MNKLDILLKAITLLYRESELDNNDSDNSRDLVRTILNLYKESNAKRFVGGESNVIEDLKHLVSDFINNPDSYEKTTLIESLEFVLRDHPAMLASIIKNLNTEMTQPGSKRSIVALRNNLNNYYKEEEIKALISKASYQLNTNTIKDETIQEFTSKLITTLETLNMTTRAKDPGIVDEIDLENDDDMHNVLNKAKEHSGNDGRWKTGWKELNDMLGSGFRSGETVLTSSLQHNYKSGFIQSLFAQLCMYNKPKLKDSTKKPLNILISFEDDAEIISEFLYNYLYFSENKKLPVLKEVTTKEVSEYIRSRLSITGFHVKILRVNPSEWTYRHMFNKLLEYEASGYEIKLLTVDYLSKLPTTGCVSTGPMGTDLRDLFNRVRNLTSSKNILFMTPHQLSSDAKQLLRNGVNAKDIVKEIAGKGFYEGSRQLDQVVDVEIHQMIASIKKQPYLTFQRGKRRFPEIIDEDKKYFMLPFPYKAPIPPNLDLDGNYIGNYGDVDETVSKNDDSYDF